MSQEDISRTLAKKLEGLWRDKSGQVGLEEVSGLLVDFVDTLGTHTKLDGSIYQLVMEISEMLNDIKGEVSGIVNQNDKMPEAFAQLNAVLEHTEKATETILDSTTAIDGIVQASSASDEDKAKASEIMLKVYEACTFQDISGQRIKKVVNSLIIIETKMAKLGEVVKVLSPTERKEEVANTNKPAGEVLDGPQFANEAPSQADIDKLFNSI